MTVLSMTLHRIRNTVSEFMHCTCGGRSIPALMITDGAAGTVVGKSQCLICRTSTLVSMSVNDKEPTVERFTPEGVLC